MPVQVLSKISGKTKVCGLFGDPVEHSFSPAMHNAAFSSLGLDYVYVPFLVVPADLRQALAAVRALNLAGVNVTVPHKEKVLPFLDELAPEAEVAGAVNTIVHKQGRLIGYNTDGAGFLRALAEEAGFTPEGKNVLVLGTGGAARAVSAALARAGAREIRISGRTAQKAAELAREINERVRGRARAIRWGEEGLMEALPDVQLVVQATPVGMHPCPEDCPPFPFQCLRSGHLVCDLIYHPPLTKFLAQARGAGARILNGLGMLLYQGVLAFELWTGVNAPVEVMRRALMEELHRQSFSQ